MCAAATAELLRPGKVSSHPVHVVIMNVTCSRSPFFNTCGMSAPWSCVVSLELEIHHSVIMSDVETERMPAALAL